MPPASRLWQYDCGPGVVGPSQHRTGAGADQLRPPLRVLPSLLRGPPAGTTRRTRPARGCTGCHSSSILPRRGGFCQRRSAIRRPGPLEVSIRLVEPLPSSASPSSCCDTTACRGRLRDQRPWDQAAGIVKSITNDFVPVRRCWPVWLQWAISPRQPPILFRAMMRTVTQGRWAVPKASTRQWERLRLYPCRHRHRRRVVGYAA